ncbi:acetyl-CoA C-acyltransferase [Aliiroseovarius sp. Z3]|uniref:acetyl-CoA C-acyltransferase n=1 Tax=Aliiroseovarius sp. Z3 TaxID=2811402 RepID=UPI0023B29715|nr:acetyl-CoA C-acyltransferase [Aliiroseovarius sp. Z3]MDE9449836.1 acetyl-CoA C-acyltransferase [Aliiroseovarius sp. Z3]
MTPAFIIAARRTAVIPQGGVLASCDIHELAAPVIQAVLADAGVGAEDVGELILSNALGAGGNPARLAALAANLPERVAGLTIDRQCCGGLDAILLAQAMVASGQHDIVLAGGAESYSRRPQRSRTFADGRPPEPYDQAPFTPWADRDPDMADAADALGRKLGVSRGDQDAWAIESHAKAMRWQAQSETAEIVPISGATRDAFTRNLTARLCARAPVVSGDITAANMAVAADGAAFCLVVSGRLAKRLARPAVQILSGATVGRDPVLPGLAPVAAIAASLDAAGLTPPDLTNAEIMEAFAVQAIACQQGAGISRDIVNSGGGGLARGHPVGASGAILAVRLYHQLAEQGGVGLAAIAAAGGLGTALVMRSG